MNTNWYPSKMERERKIELSRAQIRYKIVVAENTVRPQDFCLCTVLLKCENFCWS